MDLKLSITSSVLFHLVGLVVCTVALHTWLIWWRPKSSVWWKKADYVWLGAAVLSLASAAGTWRRFEAGYKYDEARLELSIANEGLHRYITGYAAQTACGAAQSSASKRLASKIRDRDACDQLEQIRTSLPAVLDTTSAYHFDSLRATAEMLRRTPPPFGSVFGRGLAETVLTLSGATRDLDRDRKQSAAELLLMSVAPFLLTLALALRITKVTADVHAAQPPAMSSQAKGATES